MIEYEDNYKSEFCSNLPIQLPSSSNPELQFDVVILKFWNSPTLPNLWVTKTPPFNLGTKCSWKVPTKVPSRKTSVNCPGSFSTASLNECTLDPSTVWFIGIFSS